jgi:hypothetical protein
MRFALALMFLVMVVASASAGTPQMKEYAGPLPDRGRQNLDCTDAIPIGCGDVVEGTNVGAPRNVYLYSCNGWFQDGGEVVYELVLPGPGFWMMNAALSDMTCDLDIYLLGSCDEDDCITAGGTTIGATELQGTYYIVVEGYNFDECPYVLSVTCTELETPCCPLQHECVTYDFEESDNGFWTIECFEYWSAGWEWGPSPYVPGNNVLGTDLDNLVGWGEDNIAVIGPVTITPECACLELAHWYEAETDGEGGNVKVAPFSGGSPAWEIVFPARGYDTVSSNSNYCVPDQPVFAADPPQVFSNWIVDCFDLSDYMGEELLIGFFFGQDWDLEGSLGWYIHRVALGSDLPSSIDERPVSWSVIKAIYR